VKTVKLSFNYDPETLDDIGLDPRTSEGKESIKQVIIAALDFYLESGEDQIDEEDAAVIEALLAEG
jgi:hypothetical protein